MVARRRGEPSAFRPGPGVGRDGPRPGRARRDPPRRRARRWSSLYRRLRAGARSADPLLPRFDAAEASSRSICSPWNVATGRPAGNPVAWWGPRPATGPSIAAKRGQRDAKQVRAPQRRAASAQDTAEAIEEIEIDIIAEISGVDFTAPSRLASGRRSLNMRTLGGLKTERSPATSWSRATSAALFRATRKIRGAAFPSATPANTRPTVSTAPSHIPDLQRGYAATAGDQLIAANCARRRSARRSPASLVPESRGRGLVALIVLHEPAGGQAREAGSSSWATRTAAGGQAQIAKAAPVERVGRPRIGHYPARCASRSAPTAPSGEATESDRLAASTDLARIAPSAVVGETGRGGAMAMERARMVIVEEMARGVRWRLAPPPRARADLLRSWRAPEARAAYERALTVVGTGPGTFFAAGCRSCPS